MLEVLERIGIAANAANDADLARKMGLSQQSIAKARTTKVVPASWLPKAATTFGVSLDWLYFGREPMRPGDPAPTAQDSPTAPHTAPERPIDAPESACATCAELRKELELERRERRELTAENRQLWKDNATLREENATLRERQYRVGIKHGGTEALGGAG